MSLFKKIIAIVGFLLFIGSILGFVLAIMLASLPLFVVGIVLFCGGILLGGKKLLWIFPL